MEIFLFWIHYIIAGILLYTILINSYEYIPYKDGYITKYKPGNERVKFPLWLIILFSIVFFIPILNIIVFASYMVIRSSDFEEHRVYYKSFLTKKY